VDRGIARFGAVGRGAPLPASFFRAGSIVPASPRLRQEKLTPRAAAARAGDPPVSRGECSGFAAGARASPHPHPARTPPFPLALTPVSLDFLPDVK